MEYKVDLVQTDWIVLRNEDGEVSRYIEPEIRALVEKNKVSNGRSMYCTRIKSYTPLILPFPPFSGLTIQTKQTKFYCKKVEYFHERAIFEVEDETRPPDSAILALSPLSMLIENLLSNKPSDTEIEVNEEFIPYIKTKTKINFRKS